MILCAWYCFTLPACTDGGYAAPAARTHNTPDHATPDHAVVLAYHHIARDTPATTSITPEQFDTHLDYIADNGYHVWQLTRIVQHLKNNIALPENVVALSFDDAYASVFNNVRPRLRERGWPYSVFVSTSALDTGSRLYMSWAELRILVSEGVEIGNHSHSHAHLVAKRDYENTAQWRQRVIQEIEHARIRILKETGYHAKLFAYPYGEYIQPLAEVVRSLGLSGFGQHSGPVGRRSDFTALPRFPASGSYVDTPRLATRLLTLPLDVKADPLGPLITRREERQPEINISIPQGPYDLQLLACYASGQGRMSLSAGAGSGSFRIRPRKPLMTGRTKYNCTVPHENRPGVYFWWSYLLMTPNPDGSWYQN